MILLPALLACAVAPPPEPPPPPPTPSAEIALPGPAPWPLFGARLTPPPLPDPAPTRKIYLDAGHGASGNPGNTSVNCVDEQDFTLAVADHLADQLGGTFDIETSRTGGQLPGYRSRMAQAASWGAEAFISVHSDVRDGATMWRPDPANPTACPRRDDASEVGFTILWSDEGAPDMVAARQALAQAVAARMLAAGFPAYDGNDYAGLYDGDPAHPGVFVDRHIPRKRIMFLRRPQMPSIIVETHHAWSFDEAARWDEHATREAFGAALAAGLADWFGGG